MAEPLAIQPEETLTPPRVARARRSIRGRLDRLVLVSVAVALAVAAVLNVGHEADRYLQSKRETLLATAQVFGAAVSRAVASGEVAAVAQGIRGIARVPGLMRAEVQDRRGTVIAEIGSGVRLGDDLDLDGAGRSALLALVTSRTVQLSVPIVDGGETVGRIALLSDTDDLAAGFLSVLTAALIGSGVALALGLVLAHRLQRSITRPLVALAGAMSDVERTNRYVPLQGIRSDDETGVLASSFNSMIREIGTATAQILAREDEIIGRLSRAAEQRDDQTGQHVVRVAKVSRLIGHGIGLDPTSLDDLCRASPMHDVGKIAVPDAILFKPGRLDPEERRQIERHAAAGHRILAGSSSKLVQLAAEIALSHHERWDGRGYPNRLAGEAIPLSGRITAVADVCDALLSVRPYKQPWSLDSVRAHLIENRGTHFDPACVDALITCWPDLERIYRDQDSSHPLTAEAA